MRLTVLTVPGCPYASILDDRLAEVLAGRPGVRVTRRVITNEREAAAAGMHGSPTLLVDDIDPFAGPATPTSLSCRIYRDTGGAAAGAPSTEALREALGPPGATGSRCTAPDDSRTCRMDGA